MIQAQSPGIAGLLGPYDVASMPSTVGWLDIITALNGALSDFNESISEQANLMVNALQYNQGLQMISKGLTTVLQFVRAVKRGNLKEAERVIRWNKRLHELRQRGPHGVDWHAQTGFYTGRTRASTDIKPLSMYHHRRGLPQPRVAGPIDEVRDLSRAWLTYSYGLRPLIQDIFTGLDIVTKDHYHRLEPKGGKRKVVISYRGSYTYTTLTPVSYETTGAIMGRCGGIVLVTNPNHLKLSALGLTNPLSWAYEVTPWSFVANWFWNVEEFLSSMAPRLGYEVINPWQSYHGKFKLQGVCTFNANIPPPLNVQRASVLREQWFLGRATSLPTVRLVWKGGWLTSLPRALNAASLLGSTLRKDGARTKIA